MQAHEKMQRAVDRLLQARSFMRSAEEMISEVGRALADDDHCRDQAARLTAELTAARTNAEQLMKHVSSGCGPG